MNKTSCYYICPNDFVIADKNNCSQKFYEQQKRLKDLKDLQRKRRREMFKKYLRQKIKSVEK